MTFLFDADNQKELVTPPKNWLTDIIEIDVTNLAGVPSIIYGLLALGSFVYLAGLGRSVMVAGKVLALLILPIVIVATREAIRSIPQMIREGAYGIGADKWQTMWHYILPAARPGILRGAIVGLSRAIGGTAPIMQRAARISSDTAYMHLGEMTEFNATKEFFTNPRHEPTQQYITGRFG